MKGFNGICQKSNVFVMSTLANDIATLHVILLDSY